MVTESLAAHFANAGVELITLATGSQSFVEELSSSTDSSVEVLLTTEDARVSKTEFALKQRPVRHAADVLVSARTYPHLEDHRIKDHPTLPVVLAVEWFYRLAAQRYPGLCVGSCKDLRVLKGLVLNRFDNRGHLLQLQAQEIPNGASPSLHAELRSPDGTLHYSAQLELHEELHRPQASTFLRPQNG